MLLCQESWSSLAADNVRSRNVEAFDDGPIVINLLAVGPFWAVALPNFLTTCLKLYMPYPYLWAVIRVKLDTHYPDGTARNVCIVRVSVLTPVRYGRPAGGCAVVGNFGVRSVSLDSAVRCCVTAITVHSAVLINDVWLIKYLKHKTILFV